MSEDRYQSAAADLNNPVKTDLNNPDYNYHLGITRIGLGDSSGTRSNLCKTLDLGYDHGTIQKGPGRLSSRHSL